MSGVQVPPPLPKYFNVSLVTSQLLYFKNPKYLYKSQNYCDRDVTEINSFNKIIKSLNRAFSGDSRHDTIQLFDEDTALSYGRNQYATTSNPPIDA